jgi:hypothetical protein
VARWPIREALLAYLEALKQDALEAYRQARLEYAVVSPWSKKAEPPDLPEILR